MPLVLFFVSDLLILLSWHRHPKLPKEIPFILREKIKNVSIDENDLRWKLEEQYGFYADCAIRNILKFTNNVMFNILYFTFTQKPGKELERTHAGASSQRIRGDSRTSPATLRFHNATEARRPGH